MCLWCGRTSVSPHHISYFTAHQPLFACILLRQYIYIYIYICAHKRGHKKIECSTAITMEKKYEYLARVHRCHHIRKHATRSSRRTIKTCDRDESAARKPTAAHMQFVFLSSDEYTRSTRYFIMLYKLAPLGLCHAVLGQSIDKYIYMYIYMPRDDVVLHTRFTRFLVH